MNIGILGIQGSVAEHFDAVREAGAECILIKKPEDLTGVAGLIIPGGESTTIGKLIERFGLRTEILKMAEAGRPIWGTCAGAILLAKNIEGDGGTGGGVKTLGLMDITVERNAYGSQADSFETEILFDFGEAGGRKKIPAVFIRAPKISKVGSGVRVLAEYEGETVAVIENNLFATTFHPELTDNGEIHRWFIKMCRA
ncbi:MAG: pyridoxal 5'-phosphate synthase glutaminase subunit PdxT [Candidatus Peregrinibacteria bacterium]